MIIKDELKEAQLEILTLPTLPLAGKTGRVVYASDIGSIYVDTGSEWRAVNDRAVGSIEESILTELIFQTQAGLEWVLMDGRDITGSDLHSISGIATLPDARGVFLRAKNNGRADGNENPSGDLAIGEYEADEVKSHGHSIPGGQATQSVYTGSVTANTTGGGGGATASSTGGEGRPKNITVNMFIKINR